MLDTYIYL
jgi:hypothetical protein